MALTSGEYVKATGDATVATEAKSTMFDALATAVQQSHVADPAAMASQTQGTVTDNSGGTPSDTFAAFSNPPTQAECNNFSASVAALLEEIRADVAAAKTAIDANNAAIDSILTSLETVKLHATS